MAAKKSSIANAFESQLAVALKTASITAAASVIQNNPTMTLEDFYAIIQPQGVTETITMGEIASALSGEVVVVTTRPFRKEKASVSESPSKSAKSAVVPVVNCKTKAGQEAYHRSILEHLDAVDIWIRGSDIIAACGGTLAQVGAAMRNNLIPAGLVKSRGKTFGLHFAVTSKGRRKAGSGSAVTMTRASTKGASRGASKVDIGENSNTHAARDAYRSVILKFMRGNKWYSGPEINKACGGNHSRRKRAVNNLIAEGLVEHNGKLTGASRWRLARG